MASLFNACKSVARYREGGTFNIGGYSIDIEYYNQQDIQDDLTYGDLVIGDNDENKIVLFADNTITIPSGWTLTPNKPKKSLVIYCNTLVNNGTISMYQKAPNVLPHDYYIIEGSIINANRNIVIPAYADNQTKEIAVSDSNGINGNNGTNRQCGSGGTGAHYVHSYDSIVPASGSGYAFGGGAGSGAFTGVNPWNSNNNIAASRVSTEYPMRGGNGYNGTGWDEYTRANCIGGTGNPNGSSANPYYYSPTYTSSGCGGRIIIFCNSFTNNGTIIANGSNSNGGENWITGGASGAGAIDLFYSSITTQGEIIANGGTGLSYSYRGGSAKAGNGGNGSITLTQWNLDKLIKEERKIFTKNNWIYLMDNYSQRLKDDVI